MSKSSRTTSQVYSYDKFQAEFEKDLKVLKLFNSLPDEWQVFFYILMESMSKPKA